jgi:hypothetical protein
MRLLISTFLLASLGGGGGPIGAIGRSDCCDVEAISFDMSNVKENGKLGK